MLKILVPCAKAIVMHWLLATTPWQFPKYSIRICEIPQDSFVGVWSKLEVNLSSRFSLVWSTMKVTSWTASLKLKLGWPHISVRISLEGFFLENWFSPSIKTWNSSSEIGKFNITLYYYYI